MLMSHVKSTVPLQFTLDHSDFIPQKITVPKTMLVLFRCLLRDSTEKYAPKEGHDERDERENDWAQEER
jgi:hypothetical protein